MTSSSYAHIQGAVVKLGDEHAFVEVSASEPGIHSVTVTAIDFPMSGMQRGVCGSFGDP